MTKEERLKKINESNKRDVEFQAREYLQAINSEKKVGAGGGVYMEFSPDWEKESDEFYKKLFKKLKKIDKTKKPMTLNEINDLAGDL